MLRGFIASAILAIALVPAASAANEIGRIENSAGGAVVLRAGKVLPPTAGTILQLNDIVRTEKGGLLRLALNDGSSLLVYEDTELRVAVFDREQEQTLVEMLHGHVLTNVAPYTKASGRFVVRTPTASVLAIGTTFDVDTTQTGDAISKKKIEELPLNARSFAALATLQPGTATEKVGNVIKPTQPKTSASQPTGPTSLLNIPSGAMLRSDPLFWNYSGVGGTRVTGLKDFTAVTNVNPDISGITFLPSGGAAVVGRDQAPLNWGSGIVQEIDKAAMDLYLRYRNFQDFDVNGQACTPGVVVNGRTVSGTPNYEYKILGGGSSTGLGAFNVTVTNRGSCPVYFFVPAGTGLQPKGFNKVAKGLLGFALGGAIPTDIKAWQDMATFGLLLRVGTFGALGSGPAAPTGGEVTAPMRSYCVELHKLAPHPRTEYKFAKEDDQKKFAAHLPVLQRALELYYTRQLPSAAGHQFDSILQWSLWAKIEKMAQKEFMEEFTKLVHKNYEAKKMKWDKDAQKKVEASGQDLWKLVQIVLK